MHAGSSGEAAYMGGGIDVIAGLKTGAVLRDVVHLGFLPAWTFIAERQDAISLGAGVTHQTLADSGLLRKVYPGLCAAWSRLANNRIRIKGTLSGNLMARNPSYDFAMVAIAAGARIEYLDSSRPLKQLPAERLSDIPQRALLTNIVMPRDQCLAFAVQCQWKPIVSFALSFKSVQGLVVGRLAVGCGYHAVVWSEVRLEHGLFDRSVRETSSDIAERLCTLLPVPASDWRASSEYRRHILKVLVRREIDRLRATGPSHEN